VYRYGVERRGGRIRWSVGISFSLTLVHEDLFPPLHVSLHTITSLPLAPSPLLLPLSRAMLFRFDGDLSVGSAATRFMSFISSQAVVIPIPYIHVTGTIRHRSRDRCTLWVHTAFDELHFKCTQVPCIHVITRYTSLVDATVKSAVASRL
jgi:hypothetical protein